LTRNQHYTVKSRAWNITIYWDHWCAKNG